MILQALAQYYSALVDRNEIAPPGWAKVKINYALCINVHGELEQVLPLVEAVEGSKKPQPQQFDLPAPASRHGKVLKPNFLWDNAAYLLGIDKKKPLAETVEYFKESGKLHKNLLAGVDTSMAKAILSFYRNWNPLIAAEHSRCNSHFLRRRSICKSECFDPADMAEILRFRYGG